MALIPTVDTFISQNTLKGAYTRCITDFAGTGAKTAATATSGYTIGQRFPAPLVLPSSFGAGVTGMIPTQIQANVNNTASALVMAALETTLGTLTVAGNSFAAGSSMPTRNLVGDSSSFQTASMMPVLVATAAASATTPTVTITYTNQDGVTNRTATLVLPSSPTTASVFLIGPHLQSGDTGIRAVTNISISTGTSGTLKVFGLIPQWVGNANTAINPDVLREPLPLVSWQPSDVLAFYCFGQTTASLILCAIVSGVADG